MPHSLTYTVEEFWRFTNPKPYMAAREEMIVLALPIFFIHRANEEHVGYCLRQAKWSNPSSQVMLIGTFENQMLCNDSTSHHLIQPYFQSASHFSTVYRHHSPNNYAYNLFCFQRWFILRDFMRHHQISQCCYLDSDVLLFSDVNDPAFKDFMLEYSWTTFCDLATLDRFCTFITNHFTDLRLFQNLLDFTRSIGNPPVSDMVLCIFFHNHVLRLESRFGIFDHAFFDNNLNVPLPPACPQVESLDAKKKIYVRNGELCCKIAGTDDYLRIHSLHFQGLAKPYIPYLVSPMLPAAQELLYFNYATCTWLPA